MANGKCCCGCNYPDHFGERGVKVVAPTPEDVARLVDAATSIYRYIADEECLPKHCETKLEALRKALAPFKTANADK